MIAQPVYLVVDVKIDDVEAYGKYKEKVKPLIERYGGEYLSRGGEIDVLENELWEPTRMERVERSMCLRTNCGNPPGWYW